MAKRAERTPHERVTRDDLERGFAGIQQNLRREVENRKSSVMAIAGGVGLVIVVVIFLLGRRSGKKKTTFVEIRRV